MNAVGEGAGKAVVLDVRGLSVRYGPLVAVGGLDFSIAQGEVLGLIGESGCGKTTTAMAVLGVLPAGTEVGGVVALNGANLLGLPDRELRERRGRDIALIPQGAQNSLNPVLRVSAQIKHVIQAHIAQSSSRDLDGRVRELLALVALPGNVARMYPHELSGGMKQRVCVAMAVALHPRLLIADEPTSALDVVSQRLLVQGILHLKEELGLSMLWIGHDIGLMSKVADRLIVMYRGQIVEVGTTKDVLLRPNHPYTQQLLAAVPRALGGRADAPSDPYGGAGPVATAAGDSDENGCGFRERCPCAMPICATDVPALKPGGPDRLAACHAAERAHHATVEISEA